MTIHPYEDGNGRLARALTDMALAQDEKLNIRYYSVSSEIMRQRNEYYKILEDVQKGRSNAADWYLWFIKCIAAAIKHSQDSIAKVSRATAFREIADLIDKKILRQLPGEGRSVHYDLVWPR